MIDYGLLHRATLYYEREGYRRVEAPWLVSEAVSNITRPTNAMQHVVLKGDKRKAFVASGEQSFLYMILKGQLPAGRYQTVTPCLRNDDFGPFHTKYFMKDELIDTARTTEAGLMAVVDDALGCFRGLLGGEQGLAFFPTTGLTGEEASYDINLNGVEIGSYGIRETTFARWVYGTGLALPRFTAAAGLSRKADRQGDTGRAVQDP